MAETTERLLKQGVKSRRTSVLSQRGSEKGREKCLILSIVSMVTFAILFFLNSKLLQYSTSATFTVYKVQRIHEQDRWQTWLDQNSSKALEFDASEHDYAAIEKEIDSSLFRTGESSSFETIVC